MPKSNKSMGTAVDAEAAFYEAFMKHVTESGEFISTHALGDPSASATVRVRGGVPAVTGITS